MILHLRRNVHLEAVEVLAGKTSTRREALDKAVEQGLRYFILDGTLISSGRCADPKTARRAAALVAMMASSPGPFEVILTQLSSAIVRRCRIPGRRGGQRDDPARRARRRAASAGQGGRGNRATQDRGSRC